MYWAAGVLTLAALGLLYLIRDTEPAIQLWGQLLAGAVVAIALVLVIIKALR